jgi:hypothetical protein
MIRCKYYRILLKDRELLKKFNSLKIPNDFQNQDDIMKFLLTESVKVPELEAKIKELEMKI